MSDIKFPVVPKEVIDKVLTSDDGWTTVYEGPSISDLKRQMEAKIPQLLDEATHCPKCGADRYISPRVISCSKCTWFYVPLQISHIFKKEDKE